MLTEHVYNGRVPINSPGQAQYSKTDFGSLKVSNRLDRSSSCWRGLCQVGYKIME